MKDVAEKGTLATTSQRDFNAKLHFLRVKAHQEMVNHGRERTYHIPLHVTLDNQARRIQRHYAPNSTPMPKAQVCPQGFGYHPPNGELRESEGTYKPYSLLPDADYPYPRTFYPMFAFLITKSMYPERSLEMHRGSCYFDVADPGDLVDIESISELVTLPYNMSKDHYPTYMESPEYIHEQILQRGLKPYRQKKLQDLVWVLSRQDNALYIFREKDLGTNGKMARYSYQNKQGRWQGPQTPIHIPYTPNEIWAYQEMPSYDHCRLICKNGKTVPTATCKPNHIMTQKLQWHKIGNLSEEQAMGRIGYGPKMQSGKLETVPYFENDLEDYDHLDYNGPMGLVSAM